VGLTAWGRELNPAAPVARVGALGVLRVTRRRVLLAWRTARRGACAAETDGVLAQCGLAAAEGPCLGGSETTREANAASRGDAAAVDGQDRSVYETGVVGDQVDDGRGDLLW